MKEGLRRKEIREKVELVRGLGHSIESSQRIGLIYKININVRSRVQIKSVPNSQYLVVIGFLTLNSKRKKVLIHQIRSQLVESVEKNIMVIALRGRIISLVVERVVTR